MPPFLFPNGMCFESRPPLHENVYMQCTDKRSPVVSHKSRTMEPPSAMDIVLKQPMRILKAEKVEGPENLQKAYSLLQPYYDKHLEVSLDQNQQHFSDSRTFPNNQKPSQEMLLSK